MYVLFASGDAQGGNPAVVVTTRRIDSGWHHRFYRVVVTLLRCCKKRNRTPAGDIPGIDTVLFPGFHCRDDARSTVNGWLSIYIYMACACSGQARMGVIPPPLRVIPPPLQGLS